MLPECLKNANKAKSPIKHVCLTIDAKIAKELQKNCTNPLNRDIRTAVAKRYANDMLSGQWTPAHVNGISINANGVMNDGHHRVDGIVIASETDPDIKVDMWVAYEVPADHFLTTDENFSRRSVDYIKQFAPKFTNCIDRIARAHYSMTHIHGVLNQAIEGRVARNLSPSRTDVVSNAKEHVEMFEKYAEWGARSAMMTCRRYQSYYALAYMMIELFGNPCQLQRFRADYDMGCAPNGTIEALRQRLLRNGEYCAKKHKTATFCVSQILQAYEMYLNNEEDIDTNTAIRRMNKCAGTTYTGYDIAVNNCLGAARAAENRELVKEVA